MHKMTIRKNKKPGLKSQSEYDPWFLNKLLIIKMSVFNSTLIIKLFLDLIKAINLIMFSKILLISHKFIKDVLSN